MLKIPKSTMSPFKICTYFDAYLCGRCWFCAACPNRKMYLEIRIANEGAFKKVMKGLTFDPIASVHESVNLSFKVALQYSKDSNVEVCKIEILDFWFNDLQKCREEVKNSLNALLPLHSSENQFLEFCWSTFLV